MLTSSQWLEISRAILKQCDANTANCYISHIQDLVKMKEEIDFKLSMEKYHKEKK